MGIWGGGHVEGEVWGGGKLTGTRLLLCIRGKGLNLRVENKNEVHICDRHTGFAYFLYIQIKLFLKTRYFRRKEEKHSISHCPIFPNFLTRFKTKF